MCLQIEFCKGQKDGYGVTLTKVLDHRNYTAIDFKFVKRDKYGKRIVGEGSVDREFTFIAIKGIVKGIVHIQSFNLVHRDIKPDNVLLSYTEDEFGNKTDETKISDYGCLLPVQIDHEELEIVDVTPGVPNDAGSYFNDIEHQTHTGFYAVVAGTLRYLPPELTKYFLKKLVPPKTSSAVKFK